MAFLKPKKKPEEKQELNPKPAAQPKQQQAAPAMPKPVSNQFEEIMRRLRLLEERYSGLRKKSQFTEQNMLKDAKDLFVEIKTLNEAISELRSEMAVLNEKLLKLESEINSSVAKSELNTLAKYVDMWEPMQFLTRKQAEELLKDSSENK